MKTRRQFCQLMAGSAATAALPGHGWAQAHGQVSMPGNRASLLELQQRFLDLRFGMFIHFNMATFQDREWGDPTAPATQFNPTALDTDQWAAAAKSAKMTWGCLTTKHHDGFCLWPTRTRSASVKDTTHRIDVVRAYVDSFRKAGLRTALYFSILDMRDDVRHFNVTADKVRMIRDQLTELFSNYGEIDALIIDGWNAPWSRITYEEVPFAEMYEHIKSMQPRCLVSDLNASQFPAGGLYYTDLKAFEQNAGQKLPEVSDVPAFSCVTLTDGWFWKQADVQGKLKATKTVVDDWLVPLNRRHCNLILNAPPTREGKLAPNVLARLEEIGGAWQHGGPAEKISEHLVITTPNLATGKPIHSNSYAEGGGPDQANDGSFASSWYLNEGLRSGWLVVDLGRPTTFNRVSLVEPVGREEDYRESRIGSYEFQVMAGSEWKTVLRGERLAIVDIRRIAPVQASLVRWLLEARQDSPRITEVGIYHEPA